MILAIVIACEIGFWVVIALGLIARYALRWKRTGAVLLALTPVVDVVLLFATAIDLHNGATASFAHSLSAVYLGFSIAYGHALVRAADLRFAHRFAGGPAPQKLSGSAHARSCWKDLARTTLAAAIAAGVVLLLGAIAGDPARTGALEGVFPILLLVVAIEVVTAVGYSIWPRPAPVESRAERAVA
ncbi:hypothetical protein GRS96_05410 [Rathayibacter sp. VKM Ac-2803]|uniref:hypothetical protein n=1 Tax=Rathayibacter sp. VKM Ac-2803 TaxID=2609256 RepID=UPI00135CACE1|nr:hypothetical protein [Rathayibacter sp. VKM Ac-2803]MWV48716.1 hypothetical protein [Rathayibacter sp. VKM Ac-2803]